MKKNILYTVLLLLAWMYFATLFYKTIVVMLIALVWQKQIREKLQDRMQLKCVRMGK